MPKAKTIDALLDAGATVPSSTLNVATSATKPTDKSHTSTTFPDHVDLNANSRFISVKVTEAADRDVRNKNRKPDDIHPETFSPRRDDFEKDNVEPGASTSRHKTESREPPTNARNVTSRVSVDQERQMATIDATKTKELSLRNGEVTSEKSHGKSGVDAGNVEAAKVNTESAKAASSQQVHPRKASVKDSGGRPHRQAKQTALEKLKAKHGKVDSDVKDMTDGSEDDGSGNFVQSKPAKKAADRHEKAKHLPTPVTNGNVPKQTTETKSRGKLQPVKQQQTTATATASAKKPSNRRAARDTPAPSERLGRTRTTVAQKEDVRLSTEAGPTRSTPDHQMAADVTKPGNEQYKSRNVSSPKRPGALKLPARSFSRGRRQQRDTPYEVPGNTPRTKKKSRTISKASKASTARVGPTRQRMRLESITERLDRANDVRLPSVSRQTSPRDTEARGRLRKPSVVRRTNEGSHPLPRSEKQSRDATQQRRSNILLKEHGNHATEVDSHNPTKGSKHHSLKEKPGSSQAQAIMIEQDSQSESSSSPSPHRSTNPKPNAAIGAKSHQSRSGRPQTPALMPSSPPGSGGGSIYTLTNDKPTIIAFSRQGPRNQGVSSAKKNPESAASSNVFSDYKSAKAGTPNDYAKTSGLATQLFPPSSQHPHRPPAQVALTAQSSNVAKGDESVFGDFTKNGKNKALAHMLRQPSQVTNERGQEEQDDGFAVIDDFEGTTLISDSEEHEHSPKEPTASQVAMPPPNVAKKAKKVSDSKTTKAPVRSLAQTTAKPGASKDTPRPALANKDSNASNVRAATKSVPAGQVSTLPAGDEAQKPAFARGVTKTLPTDVGGEPKPSVGQRTVQQSEQIRKRGSTEPQLGSPSKRIRVSKESMHTAPEARPARVQNDSESQSVPKKDPAIRGDRRKSRPSRRSTQASQGVDILGSPYPKDFEVPTQTTALEVYSQQAGLSSDQTQRSDAAPTGRLDLKAVPRMVPTTKSGRLSSNGKPVPAAPQESSKAVTRIASGPLAEQLLAARPVHTSEDNPFTSSRERESSAGQGLAATKFREALRQRGIDLNDRSPAVKRDERQDERFDDTERTLVEPVDEPRKAAQHVTSSPSASVASSASSLDAASKVLEDVGDWRNSLKPHQTHLFDSLVIAAHKLVRHMVDHETAERTMIADYRRRGEIIVDELQRAHAKEFQQYAQNVHGWKKQAADELAANGRKLKQSMRDAEKARAERKKAQRARNGFDGMLEELVAGLD